MNAQVLRSKAVARTAIQLRTQPDWQVPSAVKEDASEGRPDLDARTRPTGFRDGLRRILVAGRAAAGHRWLRARPGGLGYRYRASKAHHFTSSADQLRGMQSRRPPAGGWKLC